MGTDVTARHFTVDEYHRMAEAGILSEDDRVELIGGEVLEMEPVGSRHAACVDRLTSLFRAVGDDAIVRVQSPVRLGERSEPRPDVSLLEPDPDFYARGHPGPEDILLVVEVSQASLRHDRHRKVPLYAASGIPEAWIVDLAGRALVAFREPSPEGYRATRTLGAGERLSPVEVSELEVEVEKVLL